MNQLVIPLIASSPEEIVARWRESELAAAHGMSQSAAHAEAIEEGWTDRAYATLQAFCRFQATQPFTSEDFRLYALSVGFPVPVPKALGAVFKRAAREGLIRRDGFGRAFARHGSPCPRWVAAGYHISGQIGFCSECKSIPHLTTCRFFRISP